MNRTTGILSLTAALYFWWLHSRRPQVHVLQTDATARSVSYHMQVNGKEVSDTYVLGDAPQFIPSGDGVHYFAAIGNTGAKKVGDSSGTTVACGAGGSVALSASRGCCCNRYLQGSRLCNGISSRSGAAIGIGNSYTNGTCW